MEHGIAGLDVGKEGISQPLSFGGTLHQTSDVSHVKERGNFAGKENNIIIP